MNVIELKKMIYAFLKTKTERVFPEMAPPNTTYPFITYGLSTSFTDPNQHMEIFTLEVDIWDNKPLDTTALETLTGTVDGDGAMTAASGLHRKHYYVSGTLRTDVYRDTRLEIDDPDPAIRRRQLRYTIYTYLQ